MANVLFQSMMAMHSKLDVECITKRFKLSGDVADLSYEVTTQEGFKCKFSPTAKGFHVCEIDRSRSKNDFGNRGLDESMHVVDGICHATLRINAGVDDEPEGRADDDNLAGVTDEGPDKEDHADVNDQGSNDDVEITGVQDNAIDSVRESIKRFAKRDRLKVKRLRRLQHAAGVPSDKTVM